MEGRCSWTSVCYALSRSIRFSTNTPEEASDSTGRPGRPGRRIATEPAPFRGTWAPQRWPNVRICLFRRHRDACTPVRLLSSIDPKLIFVCGGCHITHSHSISPTLWHHPSRTAAVPQAAFYLHTEWRGWRARFSAFFMSPSRTSQPASTSQGGTGGAKGYLTSSWQTSSRWTELAVAYAI